MKKSLFFILLLTAIVSYGVFNNIQESKALVKEQKEQQFAEKWQNKANKIEGYLQWRNETLKNVNTGEVNPSDRFEAIRQANEQKVLSANKAAGVLSLEWESKGPDSQGGRTRTILIDKDDPELIYTGGVAGGMFRSIDGAENWERMDGYNGNNCAIMSLAQTVNGTLFVGTGERLGGFADGTLFNASITGDGIYKTNDAGLTWTHIDETNLFTTPSSSGEWSAINSMAAHPTNTDLLLVGNNAGVRITTNAEAPQPNFTNATGVNGIVSDVQITSDGNEAWAAANGRLFRSTDAAGNFSSFSVQTPTTSSRAQIAISTVDASGNYIIYASFTSTDGCLAGIYKSEDKGSNWTQIAFAGGLDPFSQPTGTSCQGWYDHCIAVNPADKDKIYIGGITFYTWGDGSGGMKRADQIGTEGADVLDPNYIHADKHFIKFSQHDATGNTMFICGDGGINKCTNANDGFPDNMVYTENNKNYITLSCYSVGSGKYGEVIAGAQDNGTQYVDYKGISPQAAKEASGGDGVGGAEISNLSPDILFSGYVNGVLYRSLNNGESSTDFIDGNIDPAGCGFISCGPLVGTQSCDDITGAQSFIFPFFLMETYDRLTPRNDLYVYARDEQIVLPGGVIEEIKDTIAPQDVTDRVVTDLIPGLDLNGLGLTYETNVEMMPGDTTYFENKFDAKYFVPSTCGSSFFVCTNPLQEGISPVFSEVTIPFESGIKRMDASHDGDLLAGVSGSRVLIMQGWDSYVAGTNPGTVTNEVINLSSIGATSLVGVSVNKSNKEHVLVSEDGYGSDSKVFVSFNAATGNPPTFIDITNNLPEMPIHSCLIDKANSQRYLVGTELGVWSSNDGGASWFEENDGMGGRFPIYALRQEWMNNFDCDLISAGAHGTGMYTTTTLMDCANKENLIWGRPEDATGISNLDIEINNISVFPNPVQDVAKIAFNLATNNDVTVKIMDLTGKVVSQKTYSNLSAGDQILEYNVSNIAKSTYFAVVSTDGQTYNNKLFIKK